MPPSQNGSACFFAEDPTRSFHDARLLWSAKADPSVLFVSAAPARSVDEGLFDLRRFSAIVAKDDDVEHVAIDSGAGLERMDIVQGSVLEGPVRLHIQLCCDDGLVCKLDTVSRLMRLSGLRGGARWRIRSDRRLGRLVEALRVGDALNEGASLREIATVLLDEDRVCREWPGAGESTKSWVRRRVALARQLHKDGPQAILARCV